ncbi:MAG: CrcB family protein [Bacillota bacterium]|nr:CrcB family protein [Bacillota bacterium]
MIRVLLVGLGGGIGAMGRYLMGRIPIANIPYPVNTFVINVIGAFLIGLFLAAGSRMNVTDSKLILFLTTGVCGGFSTLAALSAESLTMLQSGRFLGCLLYCTATFAVCITATYMGTCIAKIGI